MLDAPDKVGKLQMATSRGRRPARLALLLVGLTAAFNAIAASAPSSSSEKADAALTINPEATLERGYELLKQGKLVGADDPRNDAMGTCLLLDSLEPVYAPAKQFCNDAATALVLQGAQSLEKEDLLSARMAFELAADIATDPALQQRLQGLQKGLDSMEMRLQALDK